MAIQQHSKKERIGFIGLGATGGAMARNLLISGQRVIGFDSVEPARTQFTESGGMLSRTVEELVRGSAIVFICLPDSETFVDVVETRVVPHAQSGQVIIDVGMVSPKQIRRFARQLARKGASLLDAPVSGGPDAAEKATLRMFCGGDIDSFNKVRALLEIVGDKKAIVYCGPSGSGQVVKGVDQLAEGLVSAALLESIAYGVNAGISPETLREVLGGTEGWRRLLADACARVGKNEADGIGVNWNQFGLFLEEATEKGFDLPATQALQAFLASSDRTVQEHGRLSPSYWRELTTGAAARRAASRR